MAWAAGNDNEVTAGELAASGCAAGVAATISRLGSTFFFFGLGVVTVSPVSACSGRLAEVASCARANGTLANTTPVHRTARVARWRRIRKCPSRLTDVKLPPLCELVARTLFRKSKTEFLLGLSRRLFASLFVS